MRIALALPLLLIAGLAAAQPGTFAGGACDNCGVITSINTSAQEEQVAAAGCRSGARIAVVAWRE